VRVGFDGEIVAKPFGLLVGVGVAPDPGQQPGVVDVRALGLAQPDPVGDAQRDHARPAHVLHRLPESQIGTQGEQRNQLGKPKMPRRGNRTTHS